MQQKIVLYTDYYQDRVGISAPYVDFFSQFGEVLLVTAMNDLDFYLQHGDVLAIPGGADVDPTRYGEVPHKSGRSNAHFEYLDTHLLRPWIETGKPIIGICRGMQTLNVELGGTLFQDVINHVGNVNKRDDLTDTICTTIPNFKVHNVNSFHHQAIKKVAEGLDVIGWGLVYEHCPSIKEKKFLEVRQWYQIGFEFPKAKFKGKKRIDFIGEYYSIPEIVKHRTKRYIGFQYHPEEFNCPLAIKLIEEIMGITYTPIQSNNNVYKFSEI